MQNCRKGHGHRVQSPMVDFSMASILRTGLVCVYGSTSGARIPPEKFGHSAMALDAENIFNAIKCQRVPDRLYAMFPALARFIELWYLQPSPIWFYMEDHLVGVILSAERIQQAYVSATFLFSHTYGPGVEQICAILDDITAILLINLVVLVFQIFTEQLAIIKISGQFRTNPMFWLRRTFDK